MSRKQWRCQLWFGEKIGPEAWRCSQGGDNLVIRKETVTHMPAFLLWPPLFPCISLKGSELWQVTALSLSPALHAIEESHVSCTEPHLQTGWLQPGSRGQTSADFAGPGTQQLDPIATLAGFSYQQWTRQQQSPLSPHPGGQVLPREGKIRPARAGKKPLLGSQCGWRQIRRRCYCSNPGQQEYKARQRGR